MRVLFACRPAYGHLYPLLPLAMACRETGHDVTFGTGHDALARVRDLGFHAEGIGIAIGAADQFALSEFPELTDLPREERWRIGVVVFADVLARRTLEDILVAGDRGDGRPAVARPGDVARQDSSRAVASRRHAWAPR